MKITKEEKKLHIELWEESGLTKSEYAQQIGINLLESEKLDVNPLITHQFSLNEYEAVLKKLLIAHKVVKYFLNHSILMRAIMNGQCEMLTMIDL